MICLILSLMSGSNFVFFNFTGKPIGIHHSFISILQNGAFQISGYNKAGFSYYRVTIRVSKLMQSICIVVTFIPAVSSIQSCFSIGGVLLNLTHAGIALISPTPLMSYGLLQFTPSPSCSICLSVKRINLSGINNNPFIVRALIACGI
jgi:hypothetical protein